MAHAKSGDTVKVHYTGMLEDGNEFDSSRGRDPLEFTLGEGRVIVGFELAVAGMSQGETKTVKIPAEEAYGERRNDMVMFLRKSDLPPDLDPKIGEHLELQRADQRFTVRVVEMTEDNITIDANHPLAGEELTFDIELMEIVAAS